MIQFVVGEVEYLGVEIVDQYICRFVIVFKQVVWNIFGVGSQVEQGVGLFSVDVLCYYVFLELVNIEVEYVVKLVVLLGNMCKDIVL